MPDFEYIGYEVIDEGRIAVITLDRPKQRNAQNRGMLVELGSAFELAEADDEVRVVLLRAAGPSFSAGHDLGSSDDVRERSPGPDQHPTYQCNGGTFGGVESRNRQEWHYFFENTKRWRNLRKITVAEVHGMVLSAGLMLAWCCDLIVAGEDTVFADVVGTRLGMCGVEYFGHPWEFGPRKAKELLLTGDSLDADEAHAIGMVSKVFPNEELADRTLEFARRIAKLPTVAALLIKESVNQTVDAMGFSTALDACFKIHQLNHAHWGEVTGGAVVLRHGRLRTRRLAHLTGDPARGQAAALTRWTSTTRTKRRTSGPSIRDVSGRAPSGGLVRAAARFRPTNARRSRTGGASILADRGLIAVSWPKEYGGAGLSVLEQVVLAEEFARAGAPEPPENDRFGIELLGNTLIALGSEQQKRHFLPRILSGEDRWCQGFSEPEAGSDLASVRTRAVLDGDEWVINGQKIWTSAGPTANWIFVLTRTDPDMPKHKGLSLLLVPMDQPGVEVRPIVNAAGTRLVQRGLPDRRAHPWPSTWSAESVADGRRR